MITNRTITIRDDKWIKQHIVIENDDNVIISYTDDRYTEIQQQVF